MTSDDTPKPGPEAAQESPAKPESKGMVLKMRGGGQGGPRLTPELMRQAEVAGQAMGFTQRHAEEPPAAAPAQGLPVPAVPAPIPVQPALSAQATPAPIASAGPVYAAPVPTRQPLRRRRTEHTEKLTLYVKPETVQRVHHYYEVLGCRIQGEVLERALDALDRETQGERKSGRKA
jgi:hypothetical protein